MSDWQPIETAPRDGTHILVINAAFLHEGEMCVAFWHTLRGEKQEDGRWDVTGYGGYEAEPEVEPTHWQPLPEPPSSLPSSLPEREQA